MNELIEKLKKNEKPFGLLTPEEQECLKKVGIKNCLYYSGNADDWLEPITFNSIGETFCIKPDYQPEPEFVDLEIDCDVEINTGRRWLGVHRDEKSMFLPYLFTHLHCLSSLPNFFCFWQGREYKDTEHISYEVVATAMDGNQKVYARFRKV